MSENAGNEVTLEVELDIFDAVKAEKKACRNDFVSFFLTRFLETCSFSQEVYRNPNGQAVGDAVRLV